MATATTTELGPLGLEIRWAPTASSSSNMPRPTRSCCATCSTRWASRSSPSTAEECHALHRQGDINFIINAEPDSFAQRFAAAHGPSACAMAFRVKDAYHALNRAIDLGADPVECDVGPMELRLPAIEGIGGSRLLIDRYGDKGSIYDVDFVFEDGWEQKVAEHDSRLTYLDH